MLKPIWLLCLVLGWMAPTQCWAAGNAPAEYFTFDEKNSDTPMQILGFEDPLSTLHVISNNLKTFARTASLSLLEWTHHQEAPPLPEIPYARRRDFGTWVSEPSDGNCYNTRAKVLMRDTQGPVEFSPQNRCLVEKGLWKDPYAGATFVEAREIQIDHVVPLKHAYQAGAWRWTPSQRCTYANFVANNYHLLSISGFENAKKSDRSPARYLPPSEAMVCTYLEDWLKIKFTWGLLIQSDEAYAVVQLIQDHKCDLQKFKISRVEVATLRAAQSNPGSCASFTGILDPTQVDGEGVTPEEGSSEGLPSPGVATPS